MDVDNFEHGDEWAFYDRNMHVEICPSIKLSPSDPPIEVILPSTILITADEAERFGKALLFAAKCVRERDGKAK